MDNYHIHDLSSYKKVESSVIKPHTTYHETVPLFLYIVNQYICNNFFTTHAKHNFPCRPQGLGHTIYNTHQILLQPLAKTNHNPSVNCLLRLFGMIMARILRFNCIHNASDTQLDNRLRPFIVTFVASQFLGSRSDFLSHAHTDRETPRECERVF